MPPFKEFQTWSTEDVVNHPGIIALLATGQLPHEYQEVRPCGEMWETNESGTNISIVDAGTFYGWVSAVAGFTGGGITFVENSTADRLVTGDRAAGLYRVTVSTSFSGSANSEIEGSIFQNGVELTKMHFDMKLGALDLKSASMTGMIEVEEGDYIDLRFKSDNAPMTLSLIHVNVNMSR